MMMPPPPVPVPPPVADPPPVVVPPPVAVPPPVVVPPPPPPSGFTGVDEQSHPDKLRAHVKTAQLKT
jgi:hypothetical protein